MIINLRGTGGSGKTHTVRKLLERNQPDFQIHNSSGKVISHLIYLDLVPVYVIGSYANVCGGCDSITSQDMVCSLVRHFCQFGHVVFEGLIMSHLLARYKALCEELTSYGEHYVWAFLDTPLEVCLERTQQRRLARGDTRPFNPQNTIGKYNDILKVIPRVQALNFDVRMIDHTKDTTDQLLAILREETRFKFENSYREESFR